jgi:bifunctional non-homologous end joining protein LigD
MASSKPTRPASREGGLDEYRRKRDFTTSPEPAGRDTRTRRSKGPARSFCVQKHYDLRLEHDGTLLSWAVPKGPSLDPTVRRLARQVEDHPIDYGDFEGVIPEGYGAGIVMLWDRGAWEPQVADVDAALAKGDLKFKLDGYKLKGSWALVRTRGYGGQPDDGRSWLLIKHRDDWSGALDIAEFAPRSVKSDRDFAGILADDEPDVWRSGRPARTGATGAMLQAIVDEAARLRAARRRAGQRPSDARPRKATRGGAKRRAGRARDRR